jgi:integrase
MSPLRQELDRYLTIRRSLGYDLGTTARVLRRFVSFADSQGAAHLTPELFLGWQETYGQAGSQTWAARLSMVRLFAQWLHGLDPRHKPPAQGLIPHRPRRSRPYIYSEPEIAGIVRVAAELPSVYGLRGLTYATLFGLIAATGLRISEALALDADDANLDTGVLTIRRGKLGKARLVPLDESVTARLRAYMAERDRLLDAAPAAFFVNEDGSRVSDCAARYNFSHVSQQLGLRPRQRYARHGRGPRIHDLRHTFAARTLIGWYHSGQDAAREMIKLTTYLGHARPKDTYWYIEAVPELLALAAARVTVPSQGAQS